MGASKRMEVLKGAVLSLLMDAYQKRNKIGMVSFRREDAKLILPFTNSVELGEKLLKDLPTGGKTPLSKGFLKSYEAIINEMRKNPYIIPVVIFISDFKPNVAYGKNAIEEVYTICEKFIEKEINVVLIDTEVDNFIKIGIGKKLSEMFNFTYYKIDNLTKEDLIKIANNYYHG